VLVGRGILSQLGGAWRRCSAGGQVVVCSDEHVAPHHMAAACNSLREAGFAVSEIVIPAGERQKNLGRAEELYGVLYDRHVRRTDALVALGGGVIGDLVGFVAATFQRGVQLVQVPTTLVAQVDASLGGKVGVHFRSGRNYVGTFYQPGLVLTDLDTLATLPESELRGGMAEVVKYAFLVGGSLWESVRAYASGHGGVTQEMVVACARAKVKIVAVDEREESGERALLNLGHTIGSAIEGAGAFRAHTHGEAVGLGLRAALWLSTKITGLAPADGDRGQEIISALGLPERLADTAPEAVTGLVARDKKAGSEGVGYVLLEGLGRPKSGVTVPPALEREVVAWLTTR
jgi:3-dehydroquinate synthase